MSKRTKIVILVIAVAGVGYSLFQLVSASRNVPQEFSDARARGALIAQTIVLASNQIQESLKQVSKFDSSKEFAAAFTLTVDLAKQSDEIRAKATDLSREMEQMTLGLTSVKSVEARQAAFSAISNNLALISHLINYSAGMSDLLYALREKFTGNWNIGSIQENIDRINNEVSTINTLNEEATAAMEQFDSLTK